MAKTLIRKRADLVMERNIGKPRTAWTDTGLTSQRVKYFISKPEPRQIAEMFIEFQDMYPDNAVAVYYKPPQHCMAYGGMAFKVFGNDNE